MGEVVLGETLLAAARQTFEVDLLCLAERGSLSQDFWANLSGQDFRVRTPYSAARTIPTGGRPVRR